jgi:hypothetical protein
MKAWLITLLKGWAASWLFLLWTCLCLMTGAAWGIFSVWAALKADGTL